MEIAFTKLSPTQNVTVLVETPVPRDSQPEIAAKLLAYDGVGGEQAGFIEPPTLPGAAARLQMMGGEFCGNATMSMGAYLSWKNDLPDGSERTWPLEVSGAEGIVPCRIKRIGDAFRCTVHMPLPEKIADVTLLTDAGERPFPAVFMPGIVHVILPAEAGVTSSEIGRRIRSWNDAIRAEALGVLLYDETAGSIEPIVYVPATDSAVWERGCGSGTAALGSWKTVCTNSDAPLDVRQPGGTITVHAVCREGRVVDLTITGTVRITAKGTAFI